MMKGKMSKKKMPEHKMDGHMMADKEMKKMMADGGKPKAKKKR